MFKNLKEWWKAWKHVQVKRANNQTEFHKELVANEVSLMRQLASNLTDNDNARRRDGANYANSHCPKCGASGQLDIVDKIRQVQGEGNVYGDFSLGFGTVRGHSEIDTNEVNHCNKCGNEWKKSVVQYYGDGKLIGTWINSISTLIEGKYDYGKTTVELLQKYHAESVYELLEHCYRNELYSDTRENFTLPNLRKFFKSVFDEEPKSSS